MRAKPALLSTLLLSALFLSLPLLASCAARGGGASEHAFSRPGRGGFQFSVDRSLALFSEGCLAVQVPSDVVLPTSASFDYALYGEVGQKAAGGQVAAGGQEAAGGQVAAGGQEAAGGQVAAGGQEAAGGQVAAGRQMHSLLVRLDKRNWRWEKESNALISALAYSKESVGGRNWTVQVLPVTGAGDWFDALWQGLGRETPDFWLARRWSATPEDDIRLVVEYREEAPLCMRAALQAAEEEKRNNKNYTPLRGKELLRLCREELEGFNSRAEASVFFEDRHEQAAAPAVARATPRPALAPDVGRLAGRAEIVTKDVGGIRP